ncbi:hypothetical protein [Paenalcaligenes suwonensis]|uniref:hypothetical protein n=1 Tax=Paenalcaligenes suwonensis TaxID=1202713 RepID=UPI00140E0135|nr:hypothetical protein [Paenalcaligenes suwonensis]NHC63057.1 hypothetical protein [Paenalcaligenes suwonensis]
MKRTKKAVTPTLSPLAQYNLQRAEEAQTAHGGKAPALLSSNVRLKRNLDDKVIR